MFDRISKEDITNALAELSACCGVKEEMPFRDLITLLRKKDTVRCVLEMATRLGLPVRIIVWCVSKDYSPGAGESFRTRALTPTDSTGHGIEGITAQVSIPQNIPMFGSAGLQGFPIRVRVSENCIENPDTFVAIIAHELSHVLLASLLSPHKDSELHTDLLPILLGFREAVRRGRKTFESKTNGNTTTSKTTTYGYLNDAQFDFACNYVNGILKRHQLEKKRLLKDVKQVKKKLKKATRDLAIFRDYFRYLDIRPPVRMRKEHTERVIQLHGQNYSLEWERHIAAANKNMEIAEAFLKPLNHYRTTAVEQMNNYARAIKVAPDDLDNVIKAISKDEKILRKYVSFIYRLKRTLGRNF